MARLSFQWDITGDKNNHLRQICLCVTRVDNTEVNTLDLLKPIYFLNSPSNGFSLIYFGACRYIFGACNGN